MASPTPKKKKQVLMTFPQALNELIDGKKISRVEWADTDEYFLLNTEYLSVHHSSDDKVHQLLVREADLLAIDWIVV